MNKLEEFMKSKNQQRIEEGINMFWENRFKIVFLEVSTFDIRNCKMMSEENL